MLTLIIMWLLRNKNVQSRVYTVLYLFEMAVYMGLLVNAYMQVMLIAAAH